MKTLKKSLRGLTFSLEKDTVEIGSHFNYYINTTSRDIIISPDKNGKGTVSRKKCGKTYKPLYDIRSKEVRELCQAADYMQVEVLENKIVVHTFKKQRHIIQRNHIVSIEELVGRKTGEIVICKAAGAEWDFGRPTLANDEYFESLCRTVPSYYKKSIKQKKNEIKAIYNVASLFSGAGLLDYSFMDPQFKFVYAVDFDPGACDTYRENIGDHIVCQDIRTVDSETIPNTDLIIGGPCCQGYSNANRRDIDKETAAKKAPAKKAEKETEAAVVIQYAGKEIAAKEILERAKIAFADANPGVKIETIVLYVKPEEDVAYYVVNGIGNDDYKIEL